MSIEGINRIGYTKIAKYFIELLVWADVSQGNEILIVSLWKNQTSKKGHTTVTGILDGFYMYATEETAIV